MATNGLKRLKKIMALILSLIMALSVPSGVFGRDLGRDITYVYVEDHLAMQIPDAYQFMRSIYLQQIITDYTLTRMEDMFIHPQTGWIYVLERELGAIIVLDENFELVTFPRRSGVDGDFIRDDEGEIIEHQIITEFVISRELFLEIFETMEPDEFRDWDDIFSRRHAFVGWQCDHDCLCIIDGGVCRCIELYRERVVRPAMGFRVATGFAMGGEDGWEIIRQVWGQTGTAADGSAVYGTILESVVVVNEYYVIGDEEVPGYEILRRVYLDTGEVLYIGVNPATELPRVRAYVRLTENVRDENDVIHTVPLYETVYAVMRPLRVLIEELNEEGEWEREIITMYDTHIDEEGNEVNVPQLVRTYLLPEYIDDCDLRCNPDCQFRCDHICVAVVCECVDEDGNPVEDEDRCVYYCEHDCAVDCDITFVCHLVDDMYFITHLRRPEGIFVCRNGYFYIADTDNNRVLVANSYLEIVLVIYMPTSRELGGERLATFLPTAVVADTAGRISVVARNINNGILQFSSTGAFNRFIGAPAVNMDALSRLLRRILGQDQIAGLAAFVPTEYNNIRIDEGNFIWGTISALATADIMNAVGSPTDSTTPVKRLNPLGDDILMRKGERGIWGDVMVFGQGGMGPMEPSRIIDVGIGPAGVYTLLDGRRGRMFTFNSEGIMLFAFGNIGTRRGNFRLPVAIGYLGYNIAVLDAELHEIVIFEPTLYGELILRAEYYFMAGDYEAAYTAWASAAQQNANFAHAFHGLGQARFNDRDFVEAMAYFRHAGGAAGIEGYSRSRDMLRGDQMERMFPIISAIFGAGALILVGWLIFKGARNYALSEDIIGYNRNEQDSE